MKVVLVIHGVYPFHGYGGGQRFVYELARHLKRHNIDVEIVTRTYETEKYHYKIYNNIKYTFLPVNFQNRYRIKSSNIYTKIEEENFVDALYKVKGIRSLLSIYRQVKFWKYLSYHLDKIDADIVHTFNDTPFLYLFKKKHKPVILQLFDIGNRGLIRKTLLDLKINGGFQSLIYTYCTTLSNAVASCGPDNDDELKRIFNVPKRKIVRIPNGIEVDSIKKYFEESKLSRKDIGLNDNDYVLITVNRIELDKRVDLVIHSFKKLVETIPHSKLIIIGTGSLEHEIKKVIEFSSQQHNILHFRNIPDSRLYELLSLSNIFINTATTRYMLLTVMEAMACSLPIISTTLLDGIVINGENGRLITSDDCREIARVAIDIFESGEIKKMGERSKEIIKNYTWKVVAQKAIEAYRKIG